MSAASELALQARTLIDEAPCSTILPAGCGKTELLAELAIVGSADYPVLLLTHTNAGVAVLRTRLRQKGSDLSQVTVQTISSFAERFCRAYPTITATSVADDGETNYEALHLGCARFFCSDVGRRVSKASWGLLLVDEYQDCTGGQHELVVALAQTVAAVIAGDPLQAIFGFRQDEIVAWDEVTKFFDPIEVAEAPHRWAATNPSLGEDLTRLRGLLLNRQPVDLNSFQQIRYIRYHDRAVTRIAKEFAALPKQSLIVHFGVSHNQVTTLAKNMQNRFTAIETRAAEQLRSVCMQFDDSSGLSLLDVAIKAADQTLANHRPAKGKLADIASGKRPKTQKTTSTFGVASAGLRFADSPCAQTLDDVAAELLALEGLTIARPQFWSDLRRILQIAARSEISYLEAFEVLQSSRRLEIRYPTSDIVARTVMVKGLEFPNVMALRAERLDSNQLYVAATRACDVLWVAASSPILRPSPPKHAEAVVTELADQLPL